MKKLVSLLLCATMMLSLALGATRKLPLRGMIDRGSSTMNFGEDDPGELQ